MYTEELILLFLNGVGIIFIGYLVADCIRLEKKDYRSGKD